MKPLSKTILTSAVLASVVFTAHADNLKPVIEAGQAISESAVQSQQKINTLIEQSQSKLQQYQSVNKEIEGLNVYNAQLQKQLQNQYDEMTSLNVDIDRVSVIERQITPLMIRMIDGLEQFVQLDVL